MNYGRKIFYNIDARSTLPGHLTMGEREMDHMMMLMLRNAIMQEQILFIFFCVEIEVSFKPVTKYI
jgi:hypothetical protein